jgi:Coenzyme PQQ synthesis protein D (PqqD)
MRRTPTPMLSQRPGLDTRIVDGHAFIISKRTIKCLPPSGAVVWTLLEEPASRADILAAMRQLYPQVSRQKLAADIKALLAQLAAARLLREVKPKPPRAAASRSAVRL